MCNKDSPSSLQPSPMISKKTRVTLRPARKTRTRTRKPKFLSLRLQLSPENTQQSGEMATAAATKLHQLNLFPLHPENNLVEDHKDAHDENVEYFFAAADGGGATTLTSLLGGAGTSSDEDNMLSPSLTYACRGQDSEEGALVRTAMRHKERDASEEKWVCYSEVVERKEHEEVTSCAADLRYQNQTQHRLSLKLDYQEILNAWSDKGPLYIKVESPQTVPDLHDDFPPHDSPNGLMDGWGSNGGVWRVPEMSCSNGNGNGNVKIKEEEQGGEEWKMGQREASVLRYKEKRQNRLFSKRIRYEVRKLNAEKRPRMKGRFVKSS
uniref:CCT domain-containing protein n=1 Tax=Davidia involucrata TaxID=16924 RepID=A0A5B7BDM9_DAVIN